jgi:flavin-dependent dehydrogenase
LTPWLAQKAEGLGVDVFPGFAGAQTLFNPDESVAGVRLGDMGIEKNGEPGPTTRRARKSGLARPSSRKALVGASQSNSSSATAWMRAPHHRATAWE